MYTSRFYTEREKKVVWWLISGCVLIVLMVVVGGITRLTQSGLSMVQWEPIMGTLPPLSEEAWNDAFEMYKQTPEFKHYNAHFTLDEFKGIFFWEYLHRLLARIIGIVFIVPCVYFWIKGYFSKRLKRQVLILFGLGCLQGGIGWFMVKSGLVDDPHVSHYRLALHFVSALVLIVYIFWMALSIRFTVHMSDCKSLRRKLIFFIGVLGLQMIYGAFVAGLKAGLMYNTFPKFGSEWWPENFGRILNRSGAISFLESGGLVQFVHRVLGILLLIIAFSIWRSVRRSNLELGQVAAVQLLIAALGLQFILGVLTLIFAVPLVLGVLHQVGAILVLLCAVLLLFSITESKSIWSAEEKSDRATFIFPQKKIRFRRRSVNRT